MPLPTKKKNYESLRPSFKKEEEKCTPYLQREKQMHPLLVADKKRKLRKDKINESLRPSFVKNKKEENEPLSTNRT